MPPRLIHLVNSSVLAGMAYNDRTRELTLHYRLSGETYRYYDVDPSIWAGFQAAPSKGTYLNQVFKPMGHRCRRVGTGRP